MTETLCKREVHMTKQTGWLLGLLCALVMPAHAQTVEYIHTDALGTPVAVTDANRNVIERSEYEPYGKVLNRVVKDGPGYTGHVEDAATGLTYMQQRYYDATLGRFLSVDPVTADGNNGGNFNRYWYGNNNPYKFTDPDGRLAFLALVPPAVVALGKAAVVVGVILTAAAAGMAGSDAINAHNEANQSPEAASQGAIDKIKDGTVPASGQAGKDGVSVGQGGAAGAAAAVDTAKGVDGSKVLVDNGKTTVVQLPDGRKVESHTSTKGGQYQGDRTVKIQDQNGKVRPENIIRYPESKK